LYRGRQRCPACFCAGIEGYAGANLTTGNDNIDIAAVGVAGESGAIRIGVPAKQTATYIAGINGQRVANGTSVFVNASVSLALSSRPPATTKTSREWKTKVNQSSR
jgi:hypothetical protein